MQRETLLLSATQVSSVEECQVRWALAYIAGIKSPQTESQKLGTQVDDGCVQPYLRFGTPFDLNTRAGRIANTAVDILPTPKDPRVKVQHYFTFPSLRSKPGEQAPFQFQGYMDIWLPEGGPIPSFPGSTLPVVSDTKTTKDWRWMKKGDKLTNDVQAMIYAFDALYERRKMGKPVSEVNLDWLYLKTTEPLQPARSSPATVDAKHVLERMIEIDAVGHKIVALWEGAPKNADDDELKAYSLSLQPNTGACDSYGGCPYRSFCNHAPSIFNGGDDFDDPSGKRKLPLMTGAFDLFASLETQNKKEDEALGINPPKTTILPTAPDTVPPPAVASAPVAPPAPVVNEQAEPAGEPTKRKRRTKAEMEAARAAEKDAMTRLPTMPGIGEGEPEASNVESASASLVVSGESITVNWARECYSTVEGCGFEVGPFSVTTAPQEGESFADAMVRVNRELAKAARVAFAEKEASYSQNLKNLGVK